MNKRIKLTTRAIAGAALLALIGAFLLPARDLRFSTLARSAAGDPTTPQRPLHSDQEARQYKQQEMEKGPNPDRSRTAFVYQGQLKESGLSANGVYDFRFTLHPAQAGGGELGSIVREGTVLTDGLFKVELDFGGAASEAPEGWLEVAVRSADSAGGLTQRCRHASG
jgi:hypothetical protein